MRSAAVRSDLRAPQADRGPAVIAAGTAPAPAGTAWPTVAARCRSTGPATDRVTRRRRVALFARSGRVTRPPGGGTGRRAVQAARFLVVAVGAAMVLASVPAAALAAVVADKGAATICDQGGYLDVVGTGGAFTSAGNCSSYAARGGIFYPAHPGLAAGGYRYNRCASWTYVWPAGVVCGLWQARSDVRYSGSGWVPGSVLTGYLAVSGYFRVPVSRTVSGVGTVSGSASSFGQGAWFTLTLRNSFGQTATVSGTT